MRKSTFIILFSLEVFAFVLFPLLAFDSKEEICYFYKHPPHILFGRNNNLSCGTQVEIPAMAIIFTILMIAIFWYNQKTDADFDNRCALYALFFAWLIKCDLGCPGLSAVKYLGNLL